MAGFFSKIKTSATAIGTNWKMTQSVHPTLTLEVIGIFLAVLLVVLVPVGLFWNWVTAALLAVPAAFLAATYWFSRTAMSAAYTQIEGQPGAVAAVIESLRGGKWSVTPAVAVSKNQDLVNRVVGRPGVILISEGPSSRVGHMLGNERKKTARWLPEIPIYEIQVGIEDDQVRLGKLQKELNKLPSTLRPAEVTEIRRKLDALGGAAAAMPIPKGPMPTSASAARAARRGR